MSANRRRAELNLPLTGSRYPLGRGKPGKRDPFPQQPLRALPTRLLRRLRSPGTAILFLILISLLVYTLSSDTTIFGKSSVSITPVPLHADGLAGYLNPISRSEGKYQSNLRSKKTIPVDTHPSPRSPLPDTNYLAYLPHSGFHNQRIALENAAILAQLLNRTLLVPPVWLGRVPPWQTLHKLRNLLEKADKKGLEHCRELSKRKSPPTECIGYHDGTRVGWDWLVDLSAVTGGDWVDRWDFSTDFIEKPIKDGGLGLGQDEVYYLEEDGRYTFRIYDDPDDEAELKAFKARMDVRTLEHLSSCRLLHLGSTFGTSRLRLTLPASRKIRETVLSAMQISNPIIVDLAEKISSLLGAVDSYVALHARVNERVFRWEAGRNMREAWWHLGRSLGVNDQALAGVERTVWERSLGWRSEVLREQGEVGYRAAATLPTTSDNEEDEKMSPAKGRKDDYPGIPQPFFDPYAERYKRYQESLPPLQPIKRQPFSLVCPRLLHTSSSLLHLNRALFLASDSPDPSSHPALRLVHSTYPCVFTLSSPGIRELVETSLGGLVNDLDGVPLKPFLMAFVDAEVAARGRIVVGTKGSTFSRFVVDVEANIIKGWPITVRG